MLKYDVTPMPYNANFNTYDTNGIFANNGTNLGQTNIPNPADNGYLLVFSYMNRITQIWIGCYTGSINIRHYNGTQWTNWRSV